jgi:hypothetical protein
MTAVIAKIPEIDGVDAGGVFARVATEARPVVIRGLVSSWPLVQRSVESVAAASDYLRGFYRETPVTAFVSESDIGGRIFYTDELADTNFRQVRTTLDWVLDRISQHADDPAAPTVYMGSAALDHFLPGLSTANSLPRGGLKATVRIWIGNRTTVAAHYDVLDNVACVCAGRRRFTLFPPDQLANLYIGPIDFTPAGQSISLVDLDEPDFDRYPRFAEALQHAQSAVLEPGDAIFIPSMWWHHVQGLDNLNILINHWWRDVPAHMGPPGDALLHAILNIRDLPAAQRRAWQRIFDHYVFEPGTETVEHIPRDRRGALGELDDDTARRMRALLRNNLNR